MACINMFNPDHQGPPAMGPRISFSNDFALDAATGRPSVRYERSAAPSSSSSGGGGISSDFEFSVGGSYSMMGAADELFFKGRLLPLKENQCVAESSQMQRMTLRDELLAGDDDEDGGDGGVTFSPATTTRSGKVPMRWKSLLGLRKAYSGGKNNKQDKSVAAFAPPQRQPEKEEEEEADEEEVVVEGEDDVSRNKASFQQQERRIRDFEIGS